MVKIYEKKSLIDCRIEELFSFHTDVNNLKTITPQNMKVTLLNEGFIPKEGAILRLRTVKNFIPITWEVELETFDAPNLLVDVAMKSPFKTWKHSHIFKDFGNGTCQLLDRVEYSLAFKFLDSLLGLFIDKELESMFSHRHQITKQLLEEKNIAAPYSEDISISPPS